MYFDRPITRLPAIVCLQSQFLSPSCRSWRALSPNTEMASREEELTGKLEPPPSDEEQARELASLKADQEAITQNIASLEGQIGDNAAALDELRAAQQAVESDLAQAQSQHAASMPRVAHSISLYATISGIRWDYSRENLVAGVVSTQREVREFEFDPESASRFDITQSLWDMIDPRH